MTRIDSLVVGTLIVLLALVAGLVGIPELQPGEPEATPPSSIVAPEARPYREGVLGRPTSVSPFTARTQADRDLVALLFSGLVRNGPNGTLVPDLASRWTVDDAGAVWTFDIRPDARWHDGEPVTADDVAFTIRTLKDPAYLGPSASSWREVTVRVISQHTVSFTLDTPLGGFLQAATQPIAPAHLLAEVPIPLLPDHPFGRQPVGSGPFELDSLDDERVILRPAFTRDPPGGASPEPSVRATDALVTAAPTMRPERPLPYLAGIEFVYSDTPEPLVAAYEAGDLDAVSGLPPEAARRLARERGSHLVRYPGSTLTAVIFNLRPGEDTFRSSAVRAALLGAIDRQSVISKAFAGAAVGVDSPIPPSSPLFDPTADPGVSYDRPTAREALEAAGWSLVDGSWRLPGSKEPLVLELLSPDQASNPAVFAAAESVTGSWASFGLRVTHVGLPPGEFVSGRLVKGDFTAAVVDIAIGLDPDLYPLLASSQTLSGGSNVLGLQDPDLDRLLEAARGPGSASARFEAYGALQRRLATERYILPLAFQDKAVVLRDTVSGPLVRQVADPSDRFWDVLTWRLADGR
jgi:peptide/nickel transport system substrate-binding protein